MKRQEFPWSCGSAAVRNALRAYGHKVSERQIRALAGTTPEEGTDEIGILAAIRGLGYKAAEYSTNSPTQAWAWLSGCLVSGTVVILCVECWEHWCVAFGLLGDMIAVFDSSNFKKVIAENGTFTWKKPTLMKKWKNSRKNVDSPRFYAIAVGK